MSKDDTITVTMSRAEWQLVLAQEPTNDETYTPEGIAIFNAFQTIHKAIEGVATDG